MKLCMRYNSCEIQMMTNTIDDEKMIEFLIKKKFNKEPSENYNIYKLLEYKKYQIGISYCEGKYTMGLVIGKYWIFVDVDRKTDTHINWTVYMKYIIDKANHVLNIPEKLKISRCTEIDTIELKEWVNEAKRLNLIKEKLKPIIVKKEENATGKISMFSYPGKSGTYKTHLRGTGQNSHYIKIDEPRIVYYPNTE